MEDVLKRLLNAEIEAEALVSDAEAAYERAMQATRDEIQANERRFEEQLPELRAAALKTAQERAQQTIAELKRRYEERQREQHNLAAERSDAALQAALALVLDAERH